MPVEPKKDSTLIFMLLAGEVRSGSGYDARPDDPEDPKPLPDWKVNFSCIDEKF